jgi:hypothetical protein
MLMLMFIFDVNSGWCCCQCWCCWTTRSSAWRMLLHSFLRQRQCGLATLCSTARRPQYAAHADPHVLATLCSAERTGHSTQHTRSYTIAPAAWPRSAALHVGRSTCTPRWPRSAVHYVSLWNQQKSATLCITRHMHVCMTSRQRSSPYIMGRLKINGHTHTRMLSMSHSGAKYEGTDCTV